MDAPTITAIDNADGTATVTIADSEAGANNSIQVAAWATLDQGSFDWAEVGDGIGDGESDPIELDSGAYWFRVVSTLDGETACSNLIYLFVTDGLVPIHGLLIDAAVAALRALTFAGIESSKIVGLQVLTDEKSAVSAIPAVLVCPLGAESMSPEAGTNASDDIGYPIAVVFLAASNDAHTGNRDARLLWRERAVDHFIRNRMAVTLPAGSHLIDQFIEPQNAIDPGSWFQKQLFLSAFVVRCVVRKQRRVV